MLDAQAQTSMSALDFIQTVGVDATTKKAVTVQFKYDTTNSTTGAVTEETVQVPLLTMVPLTFLRIDGVALDYSVALSGHSVTTIKETPSLFGATLPAGAAKYFKTSRFDASFSDQGASGGETFAMDIDASQDSLPSGLSKLLSILEDAVIKGTTSS